MNHGLTTYAYYMNVPVHTCTKLGPHMQAALRLSSSTCTRFLALVLGSPPRFASMSPRNSAPLGSAILPVYNALGGPQGKGHVTFDRTKSQYLDAGQRTMNIATNGGLTIVAMVRFTGTTGHQERILDMASSQDNNLVVSRSTTTTTLETTIFQGGSFFRWSSSGVIVQDSWLTVVVRYRASTREYSLTVNNAKYVSGTASATCWPGACWPGFRYFSITSFQCISVSGMLLSTKWFIFH
jgi:hypothetical protein